MMASASDSQVDERDGRGSQPRRQDGSTESKQQKQGGQRTRHQPPRDFSRRDNNNSRYPQEYYDGYGAGIGRDPRFYGVNQQPGGVSMEGFHERRTDGGTHQGRRGGYEQGMNSSYGGYQTYYGYDQGYYQGDQQSYDSRWNDQSSQGRGRQRDGDERSSWRWEDSRRDQRGGTGRGRGGRNRERGNQMQTASRRDFRDENDQTPGETGGRYPGSRNQQENYNDRRDAQGAPFADSHDDRRGKRGGRGKGRRGRDNVQNKQKDGGRGVENSTSQIEGGAKWQNEDKDHTDRDQKRDERGSRGRSGSNPSQRDKGSNKGRGRSTSGKQPGTGKKQPKNFCSETQTGSLIEQLTSGTYECPVCCDRIRCEARVWSCKTCYVVFHLCCIKKWAKSPAAAAEGTEYDGWQCPACRGVELKIPHVYFCFCGKLREPPWEPGETPHSCGEVCRCKRPTNCPHPCNILCHPGPCPPCPTNVQKRCLCGKAEQTVRCGTQNEIRCQSRCERALNCGHHYCQETCHRGQCTPCEEVVVQECYCGRATREVECTPETAKDEKSGSYSCMTPCGKSLDCGHHSCEDHCHQGPCEPCSLDPARITHCPCGQTALSLLGGVERGNCSDPVPTCDKKCNKTFPCGGKDTHKCEQTCHTGPCKPCELISTLKCRCGHRFVDVPCKDIAAAVKAEGGLAPPICDRKCPKKKHCGRHKCGQLCCLDTEHLCYQQCGRKLKCGIHGCEEPCHVGNCPPCLHASFEEMTCHCGTEVLFPPIPCGTPPPECHQPCNRRQDCEHPIRHHCHSEEKCPPCVELTTKTCIGGHEVRYNIPCHVQSISCGRPCGKPLPCGYHSCRKTCHAGDCDPECKQPCKVRRPDCGHTCNVICHLGWPCPQITCKAKVTVNCPCGRRSQLVECQASGSDGINKAIQGLTISKLAGKLHTLQHNEEVDIREFTSAKGSSKASRILCDEECGVQERNRRLAVALQIKNPDLTQGFKTTNYSDFLKEQAKKHQGFVAAIEKELAALVVSAQSSKQPSRSHAFPPMIRNHRRIIHELAEFYGCESESYDEEPKRNVVSTARKNKCFMPSMTLTAMVQRGLNPRAPLPIPHASQEEEIRSAAKAVKLSTDVVGSTGSKKSKEKVIDYFDMTD